MSETLIVVEVLEGDRTIVESIEGSEISVNISPETEAISVIVEQITTPDTTVVLSNDQGPQGIPGTTGATGPTGPTGATGAAGTNGTNGEKGDTGYSVHTGTTAPSNSLGNNGDVYIHSLENLIYSKSAGVWQSPEPIVSETNWSYIFEQQSNQSVWYITHNLGYKPATSIVDYGSNNIEADISFTNINSMTITFNTPMSGYAYLS